MQIPQFVKNKYFIIILIACVTFFSFLPILNNDFINYDDPAYVTKNVHVQSGLSFETVKWAFNSTIESNWHPLTWISHALDTSLFGLNPMYHHVMNLFIHILSSIALFVIFNRMTKNIWGSAFVAIVFAIHPLHVESVAWIAERKDVLSGFFWILTIGFYSYYCKSPTISRYLLTLLCFVLGLLAKPMLVTLPFVLILLDYWPLKRLELSYYGLNDKKKKEGISLKSSIKEKIPFFILSLVSSYITYIVQQKGGSMADVDSLSFSVRISNAVVSYVMYIWKSLVPANLSIFYPHPGNTISALEIIFALGILIFISILFYHLRIKHPYLPAGWLWYLGTLVPVIGIVQVGLQAMADRYMYLPIIGLAIIIAWGYLYFIVRFRIPSAVTVGITTLVIILMVFTTRAQAIHWKNSFTLFTHALSVTKNNHIAHTNLGVAFTDSGKYDEAVVHLKKALHLRPNEILIRSNLARALVGMGQLKEALEHYRFILPRVNPDPQLRRRMGDVLADLNNPEEAISHYSEAVRLDTSDYLSRLKMADLFAQVGKFNEAKEQCNIVLKRFADNSRAHNILGIVAGKQKLYDEAVKEFNEAIRLDSNNADAYNDFGILYERMGKPADAMEMYNKSIKVNPDQWNARLNIGSMLAEQGKYDEAENQWNEAVRVNPKNIELRMNLGRLYLLQKKLNEAKRQFQEALNINERNVSAHYQLANVLMQEGNLDQAEKHYMKAVEIAPNFRPAQEALQNLRNQIKR